MMSLSKTVSLPCRPGFIWHIENYLLRRAAGKSVLNVGAAGPVFDYLPNNRHLFFHDRLGSAAREVLGVDIDRSAIAYAAQHGVKIDYADCQAMSLGRQFDQILLLDVIEHVERPGDALDSLVSHLTPDGELIVATPNPSMATLFLKAIFRRPFGIYWDHVTSFFPENLEVLCQRHGYRLTEVYFFTQINRWTNASYVKSIFWMLLGALVPRWNNAFIAVIRKPAAQ
jgi:SAM-dependent methyltransferase